MPTPVSLIWGVLEGAGEELRRVKRIDLRLQSSNEQRLVGR
jgi:hypothetical protein